MCALSSFHLCDQLLLYLSDKSLEVIPKTIIPSIHLQSVNIKPNSIPFKEYLDDDILKLPPTVHEEKDAERMCRSYPVLLKDEEIKPILKFCHDNSITIQSLLWLTDFIS